MANFVFQLGGGKGSFENYWPLDGKEKELFEPPTKEWWERMKAKQVLVDRKIKLKNGR